MTLVFLLEERSMAAFLEGLLPRLLPAELPYLLIPHEGKSDLEKSVPRKLRAWRDPGARFIVIRDQDQADCLRVKDRLNQLCREAGRDDVLIRIACRELESWYLADLEAVDEAFGSRLAPMQEKVKFREPDRLSSPSRELSRLVPAFGKVSGARRLSCLLDPGNRRSRSFAHLVASLRHLASTGEASTRGAGGG